VQATLRDEGLEELLEFVVGQTAVPVDRWAVAATLESMGLRDVDATDRFGQPDIFHLADELLGRYRSRPNAPIPLESASRLTIRRRLARFAKFYLRGTLFALPMVIQIVSVVALGYGLWASTRFDNAVATAVAVGTIASFVVTGGFVQAIGRLGLFYSEQKSYVLARQICYRLIRQGLLAATAVGVAWGVLDLLTLAFPPRLLLLSLVYYAFLSCLWLVLAVLYMLKRQLAIVLSLVAGIVVIVVLMSFTPVGIFVSQWVGLVAANATAALWGRRILLRRAEGVSGDMKLARLPRPAVLAYGVAPYFAYGLLYFSFLFLDRLVGWSTASEPLPSLIWFRTPYELGLDWALLSLVPTVALLEYTINEFSALIVPVQERFSGRCVEDHNRFFRSFYFRQVVLLGLFTIASVVGTYRGVVWFRRFDQFQQTRDFFASPITFSVYFWGALGYSFLVLGLMNSVFFFCLSRVWLALRPLAAGAAAGALTGFVLSRVFDYWYSVGGLVVGSLVFAVLTSRSVLRVLSKLDYYYYSAF